LQQDIPIEKKSVITYGLSEMNMHSHPSPTTRRGHIVLAGIAKPFGNRRGITDLNLEIKPGEFFTILGPSGCGKTTTLMMLAGFATPEQGDILLDGKRINDVVPQERDLGVVFQNYVLFPHMTVAENLAFPLEVRKMKPADIAQRITEMLTLVQLSTPHHLPAQLSGGQQQRVAIARSLIFDPPVLLMDEPLGALDRNLRAHLQVELRRLQQRLGITVVYVTHDQEEAMSMSDRVAIMNEGRLEQVGTPDALYETPASLFVANFLGENNRVSGIISSPNSVTLDNGVDIDIPTHTRHTGERVAMTIRPERLYLREADGAALQGNIEDVIFLGSHITYHVQVEQLGVLAIRVVNDGVHARLARDQHVGIGWHFGSWQTFPEASAA
jgi:spermidine/putrescine ABC transporter ATP-binding subunit